MQEFRVKVNPNPDQPEEFRVRVNPYPDQPEEFRVRVNPYSNQPEESHSNQSEARIPDVSDEKAISPGT